MTYAYLSYDRRERDYLFRLAKQFYRRGVAYRYDPEPPTPERFDSLVRHLIDASAVVVVIPSATEPQPLEVTREVGYATAIGKPVYELGRTQLAHPAVDPPLTEATHTDMPDKAFVAVMRAIAPAQARPPLWWLWMRPWPMLPSTPITFDPERARRTRIYVLTAVAVVGAICILSAIVGLLPR